MTEIIGYGASLFVVLSFLIKDNIKYIRLTNLVGSLLFVWYGILINSIPVVVPNAFLVVVQIVYVVRATRAKPQG